MSELSNTIVASSAFIFGSKEAENQKKDAKKKASVVFLEGTNFTMEPRQFGSFITLMDNKLSTWAETCNSQNKNTVKMLEEMGVPVPEKLLETVEESYYSVPLDTLMNWGGSEEQGLKILSFLLNETTFTTDQEPFRGFMAAASEYTDTDDSIFGGQYLLRECNYETVKDLTLDEAKSILVAKVNEMTEVDLTNLKAKADKIANDKNRGIKDGKLVLKSKREKKVTV